MKSIITSVALGVAGVLCVPALASAHVSVKPASAVSGSFTAFNVGVPNEKEIPTTAVRLTVPDGLQYVTPNVKPGWTIETTKDGEDVTEIRWTGGQVPVGQRDDFGFSAQVPAEAGDVIWKAYQTYGDGTVVAWDAEPAAEGDHAEGEENKGPYSVTKVSNEAEPASAVAATNGQDGGTSLLALAASLLALVVSLFTLLRKPKASTVTTK